MNVQLKFMFSIVITKRIQFATTAQLEEHPEDALWKLHHPACPGSGMEEAGEKDI